MKTFEQLVFMASKIELGEDHDEFINELEETFDNDGIDSDQYQALYRIAHYVYRGH